MKKKIHPSLFFCRTLLEVSAQFVLNLLQEKRTAPPSQNSLIEKDRRHQQSPGHRQVWAWRGATPLPQHSPIFSALSEIVQNYSSCSQWLIFSSPQGFHGISCSRAQSPVYRWPEFLIFKEKKYSHEEKSVFFLKLWRQFFSYLIKNPNRAPAQFSHHYSLHSSPHLCHFCYAQSKVLQLPLYFLPV